MQTQRKNCIRNLYLQLPEYASCVSVIVMSQRYIFNAFTSLQKLFHVFEKPRLVIVANSIFLKQQIQWIIKAL